MSGIERIEVLERENELLKEQIKIGEHGGIYILKDIKI